MTWLGSLRSQSTEIGVRYIGGREGGRESDREERGGGLFFDAVGVLDPPLEFFLNILVLFVQIYSSFSFIPDS